MHNVHLLVVAFVFPYDQQGVPPCLSGIYSTTLTTLIGFDSRLYYVRTIGTGEVETSPAKRKSPQESLPRATLSRAAI